MTINKFVRTWTDACVSYCLRRENFKRYVTCNFSTIILFEFIMGVCITMNYFLCIIYIQYNNKCIFRLFMQWKHKCLELFLLIQKKLFQFIKLHLQHWPCLNIYREISHLCLFLTFFSPPKGLVIYCHYLVHFNLLLRNCWANCKQTK